MADQPINGLPKKTTIVDTDSLLAIGASEEYQIDYEELADAILNKITSKAFTLDQGIKTLIAALNELNSNMGIFRQVEKKRISSEQQIDITLALDHVYMVIIQNSYNKSCGYIVLTGVQAPITMCDFFGRNNYFELTANNNTISVQSGMVDGYIYVYSIA